MNTPQALPKKITLPSGQILRLEASAPPTALRREAGAPLFSEVFALLRSRVVSIRSMNEARAIDEAALLRFPLADFHVLRAVLLATGFLHEAPLEVRCRNCDEPLAVAPSMWLALGPYRDDELDDDELDRTLRFGEPIALDPPVPLGRVRIAKEVVLAPRTVEDLMPLFRARGAGEWHISPEIVEALGIARISRHDSPTRIAALLDRRTDDELAPLFEAFLRAHYAPRLVAIVRCSSCKVRSDFDVPDERELEPGPIAGGTSLTPPATFPDPEAFERLVAERFERFAESAERDGVVLVVERGPAAADEGGDPLLGSYDPPVAEDFGVPSSPPLVTVYYATFRGLWEDEGSYDVSAEIDETIEHELEHHRYFLAGDDPMDEEERAAIANEARRVYGGGKELARQVPALLGKDVGSFFARTWLFWLFVVAVSLAAILAEAR